MPLLDDLNFNDPSCSGCSYWLPDDNQTHPSEPAVVGYCRRHAPQPLTDRVKQGALWPFTQDDDWCGDFELKTVRP